MAELEQQVGEQVDGCTASRSRNLPWARRETSIREAVSLYGSDLGAVSSALGLKPNSAYAYARRLNLLLKSPKRKPGHVDPIRKARLEELVETNASSSQIGDALSVCKERALQLLEDAGLHDTWKQRRQAFRKTKTETAAANAAAEKTAHTNVL